MIFKRYDHDLEHVVNNFILTLRRQNVIPIGAKLDETGTKRKEEKEVEHNLLLLYTLGQKSTFQSKTKIETELCY